MVKRTKKYYAPQNENIAHGCDFPGCTEKGEYRAPKDRKLKEYYWFCLKHVQEYNAKWNYYTDDEIPDSQEEQQTKRQRFHRRFRSKVRYQFGYDLWEEASFFDDGYKDNNDYSAQYSSDGVYFTVEERRFLQILELNIHDATPDSLKKQYKKMAKKYHPDVNKDDKNAEEKFKEISAAYQALCDKFARLPNYN